MTKKKKIMQLSGKNEKSLDNLYITSFCSIFFIKKNSCHSLLILFIHVNFMFQLIKEKSLTIVYIKTLL